MAVTNIPTDRPAVKDANFRITGPGRYRLGNGEIVEIEANDFEPMAGLYPWKRKGSKGRGCYDTWMSPGTIGMPTANMDIVEGPLADEPATRPFTFTGDGLYQLRNGDQLEINQPDGTFLYRANNRAGETPYLWYSNGTWTGAEKGQPHQLDIVARVEEHAESAGLTGFVSIKPVHGDLSSFAVTNLASMPDFAVGTIIDLSKVPASAIVRTQPKRVRGWVNLWDYPKGKTPLAQGIYKDREHADETAQQWPNAERIACIEIEFRRGEGL